MFLTVVSKLFRLLEILLIKKKFLARNISYVGGILRLFMERTQIPLDSELCGPHKVLSIWELNPQHSAQAVIVAAKVDVI